MSDVPNGAKPFWSDYEICMDRDGLPHYTGVQSHLMKEYRRRVFFAYGSLEGDGDTPGKEAADLKRKQRRFATKLVNCLHGEAWKAVEHLTLEPEKLKKEDGYKEVLNALQFLEKEGIIKKTEAFDKFFELTTRRKGDPVDQYLRKKIQAWEELCDLDDKSSMSEDLLSYFVLKGCSLSREDRRAILLANQNAYERKGIMQSLRVSFHDLHERERGHGPGSFRRPGGKAGRKGYMRLTMKRKNRGMRLPTMPCGMMQKKMLRSRGRKKKKLCRPRMERGILVQMKGHREMSRFTMPTLP